MKHFKEFILKHSFKICIETWRNRFILHEATNSTAFAAIDLSGLRYRTIKAGVYREHQVQGR